jgi:hypothetical protein
MTTETTTDQEQLKQLEDAVRIARTTQKAAEDKQSKREAELLDHYKSIIRQQLFDEGLIPEANHAVVELDQAAKAFEAEKDRQAKAGTGAKFPVGTRFVEYTNGTMYHRFKEPKPTGRVAVYEIITANITATHPTLLQSALTCCASSKKTGRLQGNTSSLTATALASPGAGKQKIRPYRSRFGRWKRKRREPI